MSDLPPNQQRPAPPPPQSGRGCALEMIGFILMLPALVCVLIGLVFWDFSFVLPVLVVCAIPFAIGVVLVLRAYRE